MAPALSAVEAKALLPYFMDTVTKARGLHFYLILEPDSGPCHQMTERWIGIIENGKSGHSAIVDVNMWLGKATLDAYVLALVFGVHWLRIDHGSFQKESVQELSGPGDQCWTATSIAVEASVSAGSFRSSL